MTSKILTNEDIARLNAARFAEERRRDAERLADYQRECAASWEGRSTASAVMTK